MKILMFGRGVIATTYGWALANAGHEVEYFVRPHRIEEYGTSVDVEIYDPRRKGSNKTVTETLPTKLTDNLQKDNDYDLIIVSVSHHSFASAAKYLAPRLGNATIFIFNNFWMDPEEATSAFPTEQVVWGFPQSGGGFPNGKLRSILTTKITFGSFGQELTSRETATRDMFAKAGFSIVEEKDFRGWLFVHFIMNGALHTEQLLSGSISKVFSSSVHRNNVILNARELLPLLLARNVDIKLHKSEIAMIKLPTWVGASALGLAWKFYKPLRTMAESHSNEQDMITTCQALLDYAESQSIETPNLRRALQTTLK
ncbi:MAG: hypothetical protein OCD03_02545 [Hyphomicrobiales bacterium]